MKFKTAIRRLMLGLSCNCVICGKYAFCRHEDDELRGSVCVHCIPHLALAEVTLAGWGFIGATEWDE